MAKKKRIKKCPLFLTGIFRGHPRGFGFVECDYERDIFIPKKFTQNAIDGDTVEIRIKAMNHGGKGPEGEVVSVVARGKTHLVGLITGKEGADEYLAYIPLLGKDKTVLVETKKKLKQGDRVVLKVTEWGEEENETVAQLSELIGNISDPSKDVPAAVIEYELRGDFPHEVIKEIEGFSATIPDEEIENREDLRKVTTITIDPDTAKDFDDALSLEVDKKGHFHLGVHIADVSYYVKPGTAIDEEARTRCNSTYFPGECIPMLPGLLSENLCSLKSNVNRLTASVFMEFDSEGKLLQTRFARAVIKSAKRFTYKEAHSVLEGTKKSKHKSLLQDMVKLCLLLKKKRFERGGIEFALPDLVIHVDEKGVPQKTETILYDITHQLVEEFMLKTNETVATHLAKKGMDLTYRVHEEPDEANIKEFLLLAERFGYKSRGKSTAKNIQAIFDDAMQTPYGHFLATSYIKCMKLAIYSPQNIGHYGLCLSHYCHFTSPIRRYIDLVIHRLLFEKNGVKENLDKIASHCSEKERNSARAENRVTLLKKLRLLKTKDAEKPYQEYEAIVTRIKPFGLFFEVVDFFVEGFIRVSELEEDYFRFEERKEILRGLRTGVIYSRGDRITVMVQSIDLITLDTKWYIMQDGKKNS